MNLMKKYYCKTCAWIFNPDKEEISFEELPSDWVCPVCGMGKEVFESVHYKGEEITQGEAQEKHVPVISEDENGVRVIVGSVAHPMIEEHFIEWIELRNEEKLIKKIILNSDSEPTALFEEVDFSPALKAYSSCNLHGIWESEDNE